MKKNIIKFTIIIFVCSLIYIPKTEAKTLAGLRKELEDYKNELKQNKEEQKVTESQMTSINGNIKNIQATITENYKKIEILNQEIENLNKEIELKKEEIKKVINFAQISEGESAYLEYMFGAEDFTDFIYRSAVSEQLSTYNNNLIKEYNKKIDDNKKKTEELVKQKEALDQKQKQLEKQYSSLGSKLRDIADIKVDLEDAVKQQEQLIKDYEKMGCYENEEIKACLSRINSLPPDTKFWRPMNIGRISSRYGNRTLYGRKDYHFGIDMAVSTGTPVYSVANGTVASIKYYSGTGNGVYIHHKVNGKNYTSTYFHLSRINVKVGDVVTKDTVIAYSGNTGNSTGPHLHLSILKGLAGDDYKFWGTTYYTKNIDPASVINFPSGYKSFSDRTSYYK